MTDAELIRFTLGAQGDNASLLQETEIEQALALYPDWRLAAAYLAEALAARAINDPSSFSLTGTMQVSWADRAKSWMSISQRLREEAARIERQAAAPVGMQVVLLHREYTQNDDEEYIPRRITHGLDR